jgi:hypothetical protein
MTISEDVWLNLAEQEASNPVSSVAGLRDRGTASGSILGLIDCGCFAAAFPSVSPLLPKRMQLREFLVFNSFGSPSSENVGQSIGAEVVTLPLALH